MRKQILQIFNRYLQYGGEEGSVYRIGDAMQELFDMEYFLSSSKDFIKPGIGGKIKSAAAAWHNSQAIRQLEKYQKAGKYDAWQVHNVFPTLSPAVYAKAFEWGVPIVQYLHNYRMSCTNGFFLNHGKPCTRCIDGDFWPAWQTACWKDNRLLSGYMGAILHQVRTMEVLTKISAWIAISEAQKQLHIQMGVPGERIHVVPHFYEPPAEILPPNPEGDVLFVGRLSPEKGCHLLLQAWQRTANTTGRKLIFMGDGPDMTSLREYAQTENLSNVEFAGFVARENQVAIWRRSAFVIVPSIWEEPFGMVVLEAWGQNRPVVATRIGALPELISDGETGFLANAHDADDLALKIDKILAHPETILAMAPECQVVLRERYTRKVWLDRIDRFYQSMDT